MTDGDTGAPLLVLGPLLRYVGETEATIWVETDRPCEVEILGHQARTYEVSGHHYALVVIGDLLPGSEHEYQVALDGAVRWPEPDSEFPPSVLRTPDPGRPLRLAFGSCRIAEMPVLPRRLSSRRAQRDEEEHGPDAMIAFALDLRGTPQERIRAAYMSYWIYQHVGNLSPAELAENELWKQMLQPGDHAGVLGEFAVQADQPAPEIQWSFRRTFGPPGGGMRVVVIDSRSGRVLDEGRRLMVGEAEWQWVTESVAGDWNHVVLASSLPLLLPYGIHGLEAWNEAVCEGAWGKRAARAGERIRRELDLEHWAAF